MEINGFLSLGYAKTPDKPVCICYFSVAGVGINGNHEISGNLGSLANHDSVYLGHAKTPYKTCGICYFPVAGIGINEDAGMNEITISTIPSSRACKKPY